MSRNTRVMNTSTIKSKQLHPIWRGIGCLSFLILTVGAYWAAGELLKLNVRYPLPMVGVLPQAGRTFGPVAMPWGELKFYISWIQLAATAVVDILVYGLSVIVYSILNPVRLGPLDAAPVRPTKGRSKNLTR